MADPKEAIKKKTGDGADREETSENPQAEKAAPEERDSETAPSGIQDGETPSEAGEEAAPKGKMHKVRTEDEQILYDTRKLAKHYLDLDDKYDLTEETVRKKRERNLARNREKLAHYRAHGELLKKEAQDLSGKEKRHKNRYGDKILEAADQADKNMEKASTAIENGRIWLEYANFYEGVFDKWDSIRTNPEAFQTVPAQADLLQYIEETEIKRAALPSVKGRGERLQNAGGYLDRKMADLHLLAQQQAAAMGPEAQAQAVKLVEKRERAVAIRNRLNSTYGEKTPIVRLIRKAKKVSTVSGAVPEEKGFVAGLKKGAEFFDEHITGSATDIGDDVLGAIFPEEDKRSGLVGAIRTGLLALFGKKSVKEASTEEPASMAFFDFIAPVLKVFILISHIKDYVKQKEKSDDEKLDGISGLAGETVDTLLSSAEAIVGTIKEIPILGNVFGLISNAISVVQQGLAWHKAARHRDAAKEEKQKLREKMLQKKDKYAGMGVEAAPGQALFGFMGSHEKKVSVFSNARKVKAHVQKRKSSTSQNTVKASTGTFEEQEAGLTQSLGGAAGENMYEQMAELKKKKSEGALGAGEKEKYYRMKTLSMMREYKELKEAQYVNKKRITRGKVELVHTAVDVAKNILGMVPGITEVIASALGIANTVSKYVHKGITKMKQRGRDKGWSGFDTEKSTANKHKKRSGMAENMFDKMMFVSQHMNAAPVAEAEGTFGDMEPTKAPIVEKNMNYLNLATDSLGYQFSGMMESENRETLLDRMESAFSRKG